MITDNLEQKEMITSDVDFLLEEYEKINTQYSEDSSE